jgi:hypothetical protein
MPVGKEAKVRVEEGRLAMANVLRNLGAVALLGLVYNPIGGSAAFAGAPKPGQKYALLIGINPYAPPMQSLAFCHNDMRQLKATLVSAGFPEDHAFLMLEGSEQSKCVPTKANIVRQLELLAPGPGRSVLRLTAAGTRDARDSHGRRPASAPEAGNSGRR